MTRPLPYFLLSTLLLACSSVDDSVGTASTSPAAGSAGFAGQASGSAGVAGSSVAQGGAAAQAGAGVGASAGDGGAGGGAGGSSGSSGQAGAGGSSGSSGEAGAAGASGSSGQAGAGGSSGSSGQAGAGEAGSGGGAGAGGAGGSGEPCGPTQPCPSYSYCSYPEGSCAGQGVCVVKPGGCLEPGGIPVCGCDGNTYPFECTAHLQGVDYRTDIEQGCQSILEACAGATKPPPFPVEQIFAPPAAILHTLTTGCSAGPSKGAILTVTPPSTGFLSLRVSSEGDITLAVRPECSTALGETCVNVETKGSSEYLLVPATQGQALSVLLQPTSGTSGAFPVGVDAKIVPGEITEVEPNGVSLSQSETFHAPYVGVISDANDFDCIKVPIKGPDEVLQARLDDLDDVGCSFAAGRIEMDLFDGKDGPAMITIPGCNSLTTGGLPAGDYFLCITKGYNETFAPFTYRLELESEFITCGDGIQKYQGTSFGEDCDDGNTDDGDGCSSTCQLELSETEPNNTPATADPYQSPFVGELPIGDEGDHISVVVAGPATTLVVSLLDPATGKTCLGPGTYQTSSTAIRVLDGQGKEVGTVDGNFGGPCPELTLPGLAAGTYTVSLSNPIGEYGIKYLLQLSQQ